MKWDLNKLSSKLTKLEGKKSNVKICDVRELLRLLKEEIAKDPDIVSYLLRRNKK